MLAVISEKTNLAKTLLLLKKLNAKLQRLEAHKKALQQAMAPLVKEVELRAKLNGGGFVCGPFSVESRTREAYPVKSYWMKERNYFEIKGI